MIKKNLIFFMPHMVGGGVEKNLYIVSNYCAKKIRNVYLISSTKRFNKNFKNVKIINPRLKAWDFLSFKLNYFICLFVLFKMLMKNKNSIVFSFQANIYCIVLCKIVGVKIIARSNSSPSGWSKGIIKSFFFKKILKLADTTIVNSLEFKKEFKKKFNINSICIYNPLNKKEVISLSKKKIFFPFFKNYKKLKIITIGRFTDQKDHITFLKSLDILKKKIKFRAIIIGRGINKTSMKRFIQDNDMNNFTKILDFKTNPYKYIKLADLFVLTSKFEGLPNVLLEAACLKKFIISTNCPTGPKEILMSGKNGFLCKVGDPKDISKKILIYNNNKKLLKKKILNSFSGLSRFNYNLNLNKYLYLIKKIYDKI